MAKFYDEIPSNLKEFMEKQHIFFVASAPLEGGRVNLSPKGMDVLRVLGENKVAYLDLTGSGSETAAHVLQNGRLTIMFCSFERNPMILRLYGKGGVVRPYDSAWQELFPLFDPIPGARQIVTLEVEQVQTSCGFAVPFYEFKGERDTLKKWAETKEEEGLTAYRREKNQRSIDGLPTGFTG
jgi:Pyridoxamine 5'-phosphate oxidase